MRRAALTALALVFLVAVPAAKAQQQGTISRAGAVALLVESNPRLRERAAFFAANRPPMALFDDVGQQEWYVPYVEAAFEAGILRGNAERRLRPADTLNIQESIQLVNRYKAATDPSAPVIIPLQDRHYQAWESEVLAAAKIYGVKLPARIALGQPVARPELTAMLGSVGVQNPELVTLTVMSPAPTGAAASTLVAQVVSGRPTTADSRNLQPVRQPARIIPQAAAQQPPRAAVQQPRPVAVQQPRPQPVAQAPRPQPVQQPRPQPVAQAPRPQPTPAPAPARPATGTLPANASNKFFSVTIPAAGIKDLTITHPSNPATHNGLLAPLKNGVGHLFTYPGKAGKILIYGHSSSYGWDVSPYTKIFRQINRLNPGDRIYVTYNGNMHVYQVTYEQAVSASDMSVYKKAGPEELILYTCWPPDDIKQRYLVHAKPVEVIALKGGNS